MNFVDVIEFPFHNDIISLVISEDNVPHVPVSQILGNFGLATEDYEWIFEDERVPLEMVKGQPVVTLEVLHGFLYLINPRDVTNVFREDLLTYQLECTQVLRDYWTKGMAMNRRENPSQLHSKFKDARAVSRPSLTQACAKFAQNVEGVDPHHVFDKALSTCYELAGIESLAEDEAMSGAEAFYLAWIETTYAKVLSHCLKWKKHPEDLDAFVRGHIKEHMEQVGNNFLTLADAVPGSLYA